MSPSLHLDIAQITAELERKRSQNPTVEAAAARLDIDPEVLHALCLRRKIRVTNGRMRLADLEQLTATLKAERLESEKAVPQPPPHPATVAEEQSAVVQDQVNEILAFAKPRSAR